MRGLWGLRLRKPFNSLLAVIALVATLVLLPAFPAIGAVPTNSVAPSISGTARVGLTLTGNQGTWTVSPAGTFTRAWYSCTTRHTAATSTQPAACSVIPGASGTTFAPTSAQAARFISYAVTATNADGALTRWSAATVAVTSAPVNTVAPTITGTAGVGSVLTSTTGTWVGSPTPTLRSEERRVGKECRRWC